MSWADGPLLGFDTETTGVDLERDRILSASLVKVDGATKQLSTTMEWIKPGFPIPPESTRIHGITDEFIEQEGGEPAEALELVCLMLAAELSEGTPLVGMNVPFDLTILDRNCRESGVTPLSDRVALQPVVDVMVLDKVVEPYRKGSGMRKLTAICPLYGVRVDEAHNSTADALMALRVAWRIARLYPPIAEMDALTLHRCQVEWKRRQDAKFAAWLKGQGKDPTGVDGHWPIRPLATAAEPEMALWE